MITMVNDDITKIEKILEYPLIFCLNYLTYMKDLQEIKEQKLRIEQAKQRMKIK
jgi:hypothetical protein